MKNYSHISRLIRKINGGDDVDAAQELHGIVVALFNYALVERDTGEYYAGNLTADAFERRWAFQPSDNDERTHMREEALYKAVGIK